jgi:hypothetical protein
MPTDKSSNHVMQQLIGRDWAGLEVLERDGRLYFPDKIYRRRADGEFEGVDVLLQVPREPDLRWARMQARRLAAASDPPLDLDRDADLVSNLESMCLISRCMRDADVPAREYDPDPEHLEASWEKPALTQIYEKLDRLMQVVDPRPESIDEGQMMAAVAAIVQARNILPLAVFGQGAQVTCVVTMADRLVSLLESKSSSGSSEDSTPEPSPSHDQPT